MAVFSHDFATRPAKRSVLSELATGFTMLGLIVGALLLLASYLGAH